MDKEEYKDYNLKDKPVEDCGCNHEEHGDNCGCNHEEHGDDCGCGCGCDHESEALMVDIEDEEGNTVSCEVVDGFKFEENEYAVVENPENESVYLFKVVGEGDVGELVIPDDDEFNKVSAYYEGLQED